MTVLVVLLAGAVGAWARYEVAGWVQARTFPTWPWGTAVVNLTGTALLAGIIAANQAGLAGPQLVTVAGTGFCGGLTTFSTWMVEAVRSGQQAGRAGRRAGLASLAGQVLAGWLLAVAILSLV